MAEKTKTVTEKKDGELDAAKAAAVLEQATQARVQKCHAEVNAILKKHNCSLMPILEMAGEQMRHQVQIVPNK